MTDTVFELPQHSVCLNREENFRLTRDLVCARKSFDAKISRWSLLHSVVKLCRVLVRKTFRLHSSWFDFSPQRAQHHHFNSCLSCSQTLFSLASYQVQTEQESFLSHFKINLWNCLREWRRRRWLNRVWRVQIESVMTSFGWKWNLNLLKVSLTRFSFEI